MAPPGSRVHPCLCSKPLLRGVAEAALSCAHQATLILLHDPSTLACCSSQGSLVDPRVRASNEHIHIVRVPRAGGRPGCPSHPSKLACFLGQGLVYLVCLVYLVYLVGAVEGEKSGTSGTWGMVCLVSLVYRVCLVGRIGSPTRRTRETRQTEQTGLLIPFAGSRFQKCRCRGILP
jgi:hypothetical protein